MMLSDTTPSFTTHRLLLDSHSRLAIRLFIKLSNFLYNFFTRKITIGNFKVLPYEAREGYRRSTGKAELAFIQIS